MTAFERVIGMSPSVSVKVFVKSSSATVLEALLENEPLENVRYLILSLILEIRSKEY